MLENDKADELGHAVHVKIVGEARDAAAVFLEQLIAELSGTFAPASEFISHLTTAAACYRNVSECFRVLGRKFPYPAGASLNAAGKAEAVRLLRQAWHSEEQGVQSIEALAGLMETQRIGDDFPALIEPSPFFLF